MKKDERRPSIRSEALEANLRETRADVEIPAEFLPLLDAARPHRGLHDELRRLLEEYFHPFRDDEFVVENMALQVLGRWFRYRSKPERGLLFSLFARLLCDLALSAGRRDLREESFRVLFAFLGEVMGLPEADEYAPAAAEALRKAAREGDIDALLGRDRQLRSLAKRLGGRPEVREAFEELYRRIVAEGLARAAERLDFPAWADDNPGLLEDPAALKAAFAGLDLEAAERAARRLRKGGVKAEELLSLPTLGGIINDALLRLSSLKNPSDALQAALFFLKDDTALHRQGEILSLLMDRLNALVSEGDERRLERTIHQLTAFLKRRSDFSAAVRFDIYERIGRAAGRAGLERAARALTDAILSWRFEEPGVQGATEEWKMRVNPHHVANIRCLLSIIASNPPLYRRLICALTLFLRFGGVFVPDTALLQKDVSALLAADIGPVYHHVRQLLRSLPVFFNELGAEGELRRLSTALDQASARRDSIVHFLRKAVHAETNNLLVDFSLEVLRYWATGETKGLLRFLPPSLASAPEREAAFAEGPRRVLAVLAPDGDLERLLAMSPDDLERRAEELRRGGADPDAVERVRCLVRMTQLLRDKYFFSASETVARVAHSSRIPDELRERFERAAAGGNDRALVDALLDVVEHLKGIVLSRAPTPPQENIYYKRHVAAGIPSMYGDYREERFDALGLSFRLERMGSEILARLAARTTRGAYLSKEFLWASTWLLERFRRALDADGLLRDSFVTAVDLLEKSLESYRITYRQFRDILKHFLASAVRGTVEGPVLGEFAEAASQLARNGVFPGFEGEEGAAAAEEAAVREAVAGAFGLQELDAFVTRMAQVADECAHSHAEADLSAVLNFRASRLITFVHDPLDPLSDPMHLGSKGFFLKRLAALGCKVPEGFIVSTELFGVRGALGLKGLAEDVRKRLAAALARLERDTGRRLGDPGRLLMLSVRSSGTSSMPGMMSTFLNVGLNDEVVEALARRHNYGWTAWDCYRRFLQCWGMSEGIPRDDFDAIMRSFKERYGVKLKVEFTASAMREMAYAYKARLADDGVTIPDDPFEQVAAAVMKVLDSWDSEQAVLYRRQMDIADEWGTAAVVQRMVLGNISYDSGTGVVFTRPPHSRGYEVVLEGDYVFCSQGEDLVAGLVFPLPVSERQRREQRIYRSATGSLEAHLPAIYARLEEIARKLVFEHSFEHQEIEFTFEGSSPDDLYILQSRPMVFDDEAGAAAFAAHDRIWESRIASGLGCGGGAFTGRLVVRASDIERMKREHPGDPLLLARPDTVPEDIVLIVKAEGLLTARGGGTSHAAITAKRLGKVCVVNCRAMEVDEERGTVRFGDRVFSSGEWLSINGDTGDVYAGRHEVVRGAPPLHDGKEDG